MNLSKKHMKIAIQKDASMIACTPVSARLMYWKKKNGLTYDELSYLINDGWHLYGNTVKDFIFHGGRMMSFLMRLRKLSEIHEMEMIE